MGAPLNIEVRQINKAPECYPMALEGISLRPVMVIEAELPESIRPPSREAKRIANLAAAEAALAGHPSVRQVDDHGYPLYYLTPGLNTAFLEGLFQTPEGHPYAQRVYDGPGGYILLTVFSDLDRGYTLYGAANLRREEDGLYYADKRNRTVDRRTFQPRSTQPPANSKPDNQPAANPNGYNNRERQTLGNVSRRPPSSYGRR